MHASCARFFRVAVLAIVFVTASRASASAQRLPTCRERAGAPALGFGVAGIASDLDVSPALDDPAPYASIRVRGGPGLSIDGSIPLHSVPLVRSWSLRVSGGIASFGADRITFDRRSYKEASHEDAGAAPVRRLQLGVVRGFGGGRWFCGYGGFSAGVFEISYKGVTTRPVSVSGMLGLDVPIGIDSPNSVAVEFQFDVAPNHSRPPLNAYDIVTLGATFVFRHRF